MSTPVGKRENATLHPRYFIFVNQTLKQPGTLFLLPFSFALSFLLLPCPLSLALVIKNKEQDFVGLALCF